MIPFLLQTPQPGWPRLTRPVPSPVPLRLSHGSAGSAPSTSPCVCPARTPGHQRRKLPLPLQLPGFRTAPRPCQGTSCAVATILLTLGLNTARAPPPGEQGPSGSREAREPSSSGMCTPPCGLGGGVLPSAYTPERWDAGHGKSLDEEGCASGSLPWCASTADPRNVPTSLRAAKGSPLC